mmetsp:Transcript_27913/g.65263  ORF Transcript_27913/g.65263 Transcript_27913/m.65263 type:complete len:643 (-) Transcript_27913:67-1995(-)
MTQLKAPTKERTLSPQRSVRRISSPGKSPTNSGLLPVMDVRVFDDVLKEDYFLKRRENPPLIGSIDQGTSSTRFVVYTKQGRIAAAAQVEHTQIYLDAHAGWHEHSPLEIFENTKSCIEAVGNALKRKGVNLAQKPLSAVGITNQRETTLAWNRQTGIPYYPAIVWDDTRTQAIAEQIGKGDQDLLRDKTGLPLTSYFAGTKVKWLLDNVKELQIDLADRDKRSDVCFGTIDTWLIYQLTGTRSSNPNAANVGGEFCTDVTNASRWLFLDIETVEWDSSLVDTVCAPHQVPLSALPKVCPSCHVFGVCNSDNGVPLLQKVPITAVLGDQHAALFGQTAFSPGEAKNTYGTGLFLMMNTGQKPVPSTHGLLTTIAYQLGHDQPVCYALEGSVSHSGSTIQWLRDQLQVISSAPDSEKIATSSNDGLYFVPAFAGLFAPHWRSDARACLVGLTTSHHKGHICRAALEAAAYQSREVFESIERDSGVKLKTLNVDGGATANKLLMQFQADMLNVPVVKPVILETTSMGAAFCAGLAIGVWKDVDEIKKLWAVATTFTPQMVEEERHRNWNGWCKAVGKSLGWVDIDREAGGKGDTMDDETFDDFEDAVELTRKTSLGIGMGLAMVMCASAAFATGFLVGTKRVAK